MNSIVYTESLPERTKGVVTILQQQQPTFLQSFYLSGGTGLSLQIGHRESEDLDFFCQNPFNPLQLEKELAALGKLESTELAVGTLNTFFNQVKLQFLEYPYPLIQPSTEWRGIKLSSVLDIACTKLQTLSMRGSKKDFVDIFFLLNAFSLQEILLQAETKYSTVNYNQAHILKSLVYFDDAEHQPMPRMIKQISWIDIKQRMVDEVKKISFV